MLNAESGPIHPPEREDPFSPQRSIDSEQGIEKCPDVYNGETFISHYRKSAIHILKEEASSSALEHFKTAFYSLKKKTY